MDAMEKPCINDLYPHRTKTALYQMVVEIIDHNQPILPERYRTGANTPQEEADRRIKELTADGWTVQQFDLSEAITLLATKHEHAKTIHIAHDTK